MTDAAGFRAQFPVFENVCYLNAGTEGPVPKRAAEQVHRRIDVEASAGRCGRNYIEQLMALAGALRGAYAGILGCDTDELALTGSTTDGVNTVISGLDLQPGDEILTSDEEHPGLLAPLGRARRRDRIAVRVVPFAELVNEIGPRTRLVACSHVSWVSGRVVDAAGISASGVPLLLDGAQGVGAVPVDVRALGCDFYAGSGQKWLCGPEGSGCLYVRREQLEELLVPWPGYGSVADPGQALDFHPAQGAARLDHGFPAGMRSTWALAALETLAEAGWQWVHGRAAKLAGWLAERLGEEGLEVFPRGDSTLVSWRVPDAQAEVERLSARGFVVRSIPALELVRASVGAWSAEEELDALVGAAVGS